MKPGDRVGWLDVLRGFAICGILLVNFEFFASPALYWRITLEYPSFDGTADSWARLAILFFAEGKFITLLAFLFGAGFAIITEKPALTAPARLLVRRYLWLSAFGLAHASLLWFGDILFVYALVGLLLIPFRTCRPRTLLLWSLSLLGAMVLFWMSTGVTMALGGASDLSFVAPLQERAEEIYRNGTWLQVTLVRSVEAIVVYTFMLMWLPSGLAVALFGAWAWRTGRLQSPTGFRRLALFALPLALAGQAMLVYERTSDLGDNLLLHLLWMVAYAAAVPALSLVYLGLLQALYARHPRLLSWLAPIGRMALTNYLLHSLIFTTLFYGYGGGWWGRVGPAGGLVLVVATWTGQAVLSRWWLKHFAFGPVEALWRRLTYR